MGNSNDEMKAKNINLTNQPHRLLIAIILGAIFSFCLRSPAADADGDGIPDEIENQLLARFAPIIYPNEIHDFPEGGSGVPVSVAWLLRNSRIMFFNSATTNWAVAADRPSVSAALAQVNASGNGGQVYRLRNYYLWGDAPGDTRSWPISISLGEGVYGRVWKPWAAFPYIYSVQYFVLLTWNETAYSGGSGNHESDWACVDFAIDVRSGYENPPILHAIYHCHGPQNFITPELLQIENGHPVVYFEKGTNESWPNRGGRGFTGWPNSNGFETDGNWDNFDWVANFFIDWFTLGTQEVNEDKIVREHNGDGNRYATHDVRNIGGVNPTNGPVSLCGDEGLFLLKFQGKYGFSGTFPGDPPEGPPWQDKMWKREWYNNGIPLGPWTPARNPFSQDISGYYINTTAGYTFTVPPLRDTTYVNVNVASEGTGSSSQPHKNLLLGIAMTADNGTVVMQPGNVSAHFTINQPVTLTATNGVVTLGQ